MSLPQQSYTPMDKYDLCSRGNHCISYLGNTFLRQFVHSLRSLNTTIYQKNMKGSPPLHVQQGSRVWRLIPTTGCFWSFTKSWCPVVSLVKVWSIEKNFNTFGQKFFLTARDSVMLNLQRKLMTISIGFNWSKFSTTCCSTPTPTPTLKN